VSRAGFLAVCSAGFHFSGRSRSIDMGAIWHYANAIGDAQQGIGRLPTPNGVDQQTPSEADVSSPASRAARAVDQAIRFESSSWSVLTSPCSAVCARGRQDGYQLPPPAVERLGQIGLQSRPHLQPAWMRSRTPFSHLPRWRRGQMEAGTIRDSKPPSSAHLEQLHRLRPCGDGGAEIGALSRTPNRPVQPVKSRFHRV